MFTEKAALALAVFSLCGLAHTEGQITSDTHFYGESPAVYPSRSGDWAGAYKKASALVAQMTLEEKNNLTYGITSDTTSCVGVIGAIERLGFPGLCMQDAGNGVRMADFVNSYPSGIHVGASWNKSLAHDRGWHMAGEFRTKGINVALGPVVAPLGRTTTNGRNWEGVASDPYLSGALAASTVDGMQGQGVIASVKHFIGYEQEAYRNPTTNSDNETVASVSSNIDDKTMHESYLWPFQDALKAGAGNIMCSYNRINNSYACQNSKTLNGLLKEELGFNGFVVTDWYGQHSGVGAALAGLDMAMPNGLTFWGPNFTEAVTNGSVPLSRLDDMATRIVAAWYQMNQDAPSYPELGIGMPPNISAPHNIVNALTQEAKPVLFEGAVEGHVLVKNVNNALPLSKPKLLSVFGWDATAPKEFMPNNVLVSNAWEMGYEPVLFEIEALSGLFGSGGQYIDEPLDYQVAFNGTLSVGGGSGANAGPYISAPLDAIQQRAYQDNTAVMWDTGVNPNTLGVMEASDACLVFINAFASEGVDRSGTYDSYSDALVAKVAKTCPNTIVIIHNAGTRMVESFVENPNVTAIVFAHLPGQDSGRAITSLLYGDSNFSGKLPYTVAKNETDYPAYWHDYAVTPYELYPQSNFTEGWFDAKNIEPRYAFGYGLSYTTFSFSNLKVSSVKNGIAAYPTGVIEQGGQVDLWDTVTKVTAIIKNTGRRSGAEVAQIYVGIPGGPVKQLRGFDKVLVPAGKSVQVSFPLTRRDLSTWNVTAQKWELQSGNYEIYVGSSSRDLPLKSTLKVTASSK
ncbi:hypothetical protein N7478_004196 [Penicillium angulare]|uniref:uncharacterized protein n=1 Tax=Penicillium angulare TaxID=116970 RepID=UPI00253FE39C|nr:uncharacterized protein N7478_004196 [Penicillium angulare]KAJ5278824.1 hypothetical protein N7478_004196 [Penicillium angulare]